VTRKVPQLLAYPRIGDVRGGSIRAHGPYYAEPGSGSVARWECPKGWFARRGL
jgi:hypothetical protein